MSETIGSGVIHVLYDLVGPDGKTIKERNFEKHHAVPLYSLVEVDLPNEIEHGMRLFVQSHSRDCDGTPLYNLTLDWRLIDRKFGRDYIASNSDPASSLTRYVGTLREGAVIGGYSESSFKVVCSAEEIIDRIKLQGWMDNDGNRTDG